MSIRRQPATKRPWWKPGGNPLRVLRPVLGAGVLYGLCALGVQGVPGSAHAEAGGLCRLDETPWSTAEQLTCSPYFPAHARIRDMPASLPQPSPGQGATPATLAPTPLASAPGPQQSRPAAGEQAPPLVVPDTGEPTTFERAEALAAAGSVDEALALLAQTQERFPRLEDRVSLLRAHILLDAGRYAEAKSALRVARSSIDSCVRTEAEVSEVRARILADEPRAESALRGLLGRYRELPAEAQLRLMLGESLLRRNRLTQAAETFRKLDLRFPGSPEAHSALAQLEALREAGVRVRRQRLAERVDRAERLVSLGHHDDARAELAALEEVRMGRPLRSRVHLAASQLARIEGRWSEAHEHMRLGIRSSSAVSADEAEERAERAADLLTASLSRDVEIAERRVERMVGRRGYNQLASSALVQIIQIGSRAGLREPVRAAAHVLAGRGIAADARVDAALEAMGLADDADLVRMFDPLINTRTQRGTQAAYYRARALERLGRLAEAQAGYRSVKENDRTPQRYYAMWSNVRLQAIAAARQAGGSIVDPASVPNRRPEGSRSAPSLVMVEGVPAAAPQAQELRLNVDLSALAQRLEPLAEEHGAAFPWLPRAHDLLQLGEADIASKELYETFLHWRAANGNPLRRVGLEGVARGGDRRRTALSFAARRGRLNLDLEDRTLLAEVSGSLGDYGTAVGLAGWERVGRRPRAHAHLVEAAARRHGLDPNLLFAIMRVESVYQRGIISYAGAIGLTQIMPRTGRLIARARGMHDFDTGDLVDPELNLDFAAWYLASLIERFDGHLPLAIASYNGGPHNVRRWLRSHGPNQPIDAFLEFIPFDQTHRYVRRVLTHYQAYRAQEGLPPEALSMTLPSGDDHEIAF